MILAHLDYGPRLDVLLIIVGQPAPRTPDTPALRPRPCRSVAFRDDVLHLVKRTHVESASLWAGLGGMPAVSDSVADALISFQHLTVEVCTIRSSYESQAQQASEDGCRVVGPLPDT